MRKLVIGSMGSNVSKHYGGQEDAKVKVLVDQTAGKGFERKWNMIMFEMVLVSFAIIAVPSVMIAAALVISLAGRSV